MKNNKSQIKKPTIKQFIKLHKIMFNIDPTVQPGWHRANYNQSYQEIYFGFPHENKLVLVLTTTSPTSGVRIEVWAGMHEKIYQADFYVDYNDQEYQDYRKMFYSQPPEKYDSFDDF